MQRERCSRRTFYRALERERAKCATNTWLPARRRNQGTGTGNQRCSDAHTPARTRGSAREGFNR